MSIKLHRKQSGTVATPRNIAEYLVSWAVRDPRDIVLDPGAGEGVFLFEAYKRLMCLGADRDAALSQIIGVEQNPILYRQALHTFESDLGCAPPRLVKADLFDLELPKVGAIVGNPPYVRRIHLDCLDKIRNQLTERNLFTPKLNGLTDLYVYFLTYAWEYLKEGGRTAIIVSSAWLDVDYGIPFKELLLRDYNVYAIVMSEGRFFEDALVKSVLLFAEKGRPRFDNTVRFIRMPGTLTEMPAAEELVDLPSGACSNGAAVFTIPQRELDPAKPWGLYLKTPEAYASLVRGGALTHIRQLASSRIGIQTLAGGFYILSQQRLRDCSMPKAYVQPLALSPRDLAQPTIETEDDVRHYVLYVRSEKNQISEPAVSQYIDRAEKQLVPIRGKGKTVVGYQNLPRLQKAGRNPWYNLVSEIERRGRYAILLPRRFYEEFLVIWNRARVVANENFIELEPYDDAWIKPMLAFFNSSYFELVARSHAQLYGGGVYNLNPADVPDLPFLDVRLLTHSQMTELAEAYDKFASCSKEERRTILDTCLRQFLLLSNTQLRDVREAVLQLREISRRAKRYLGITPRQVGDSLFQ